MDKYWRLTIIWEWKIHIKPNWWKVKYVRCICNCWRIKQIAFYHIKAGRIKSCGCLLKEVAKITHTKHWLSNSKIKWVYYWMLQRCNDKKFKAYNNYWWRWIECEWGSFQEFLDDMLINYQDWLEIDRINNDWNYSKDNCRWVTKSLNNRNKRTNHIYKWICLKEWSEIQNIKYSTLLARLKYWWSYEKALWLLLKKWERIIKEKIAYR